MYTLALWDMLLTTLTNKPNFHLNNSIVQLKGRYAVVLQNVVVRNYKRGGPDPRGLLLDFTRKVPVHYMNMLKKSTLYLCIGLSKN